MASILRAGIAALVLSAVACGGADPESKMPRGGDLEGAMPNESPAVVKTPITQLRRSEVKSTIARGPGYFLQNVELEDNPVMHDGKFYGFTIKALNDTWGIDLQPGDVVTRVNGVVPEKPDDALVVFKSLENAKSLKVDYERAGKPRSLELPIVD